MKLVQYIFISLFITFIGALIFEGCASDKELPIKHAPCLVCGAGCAVPTFNSVLPTDVALLNQRCVNAFVWQSFFALTWPADPNNAGEPDTSKTIRDYGKPGDLTPMTWNTYKDVEEVFTDHKPTPWGHRHREIMNEHKEAGCQLQNIKMIHKFHRANEVVAEFLEAGGKNLWITDQDSNLVWSEVKMNKLEFEYITNNKLYIPEEQLALSENTNNDPPGIILPNNSIELKASWRIIPDDQFEKLKHHYKIIRACVPNTVVINPGNKPPTVSDYEEHYLGLIGMHVINKLPKTPQFIWATFEHNDLAPVDNEPVDLSKDYLLYNKTTPEAKYNQPTSGGTNVNIPTQVKKSHLAKTGIEAAELNKWVQEQLELLAPGSVFQNYHLVDVQWPTSAVADAKNITPLSKGGMTPQVMTNVTLETYKQGISCLDCHVHGSISQNGLNLTKEQEKYSTDYSFLFGSAVPQKD